MRFSLQFFCVAFLTVLAGKVAALSIILTALSNPGPTPISASDFVSFDSTVRQGCNDDCSPAVDLVEKCGTDDSCLCNNDTVKAVLDCQQCMFKDIISAHRLPTDSREGLTSALAAYAKACSNHTVDPSSIKLSIPANWDGPFEQLLTPFTTAVTVIAATVLGVGMITVVNTM